MEDAATGGADEKLLREFAELARAMSLAETLDEILHLIVESAHERIDNCDGASLMLIRGREISTPAFSSDIARASDLAQKESGEGPCLGAIADQRTVIIDDLEDDDRWPAYRRRGLDLGIRSMISFRLFVDEDTMGALNLHSAQPHAFDDRSKAVGEVLASHAAVAMKAAISEAGLQAALESRDVIGQAKGIVMEREHVTGQEAFDRLRELSQRRNQRLRDLAQDIAETGDIPQP